MILLTTAYDPGSLDSGKSYTHVKITDVSHTVSADRINISVKRGYLVESVFTEGKTPPTGFQIVDVDEGTDMTDLQAIVSTASELCYVAFMRALDQWLIDKAHYPGTIA